MSDTEKDQIRYYWDACVFLEVINASPDRLPALEGILDDCDNHKLEIYTSMLTIAEVAYARAEKESRSLEAAVDDKINKLWEPGSPIKVVEVYQSIAYDAKELIRQGLKQGWVLKPFDAVHLATAKRMGVSEFHTYDEKRLPRYSEIVGYKILKPHTDRLPFPSTV
ncbi:MAG: type II toxin-antitoxin system VapC family toxin [Planctomycetota bacterium]|jgi:predicted nucleic acid-binding protein